MSDKLILKGVMSQGYGTVPKLVMRDKNIDSEAKAIYAYICSFAGTGTSAFPGIKIMCEELPMSEKRFHKFKNQLIEHGYLHIERERKSDGSGWGNNIYYLIQEVPETDNKETVTGQNDRLQSVTGQSVTLQNVTRQNVTLQNDCTNNNSITNNSSINNSITKEIQQPASEKANFITAWEKNGFGPISPINIEKLDYWVKDFDGKEEIIVKAIEVAEGYGKRFYNYIETILKSWENKGVKSLDDIAALEKQRETELEAKKSAPKNNYSKQPIRKETLPDWSGKPEVVEKEMSADQQQAMQERLKKIRSL